MEFDDYKADLYKAWHHRIQRVCWFFTAAVFITEVAMFFVFINSKTSPVLPGPFILQRVILPSLINIVISVIVSFIFYNRRLSTSKKNWSGCMALMVISSNIAISHFYFPAVLLLPCVSIFISAIFADKKLINTTALFVGLFSLAAILLWAKENSFMELSLLIANCTVYVIIIVCCYLLSLFIMKSQQQQVDFIFDAYKKQQELIEEMNIEPMTRLYNKTALDSCMKLYIQKFHNKEFTPHLVLLDIDLFKTVNDVYGHNAGDVVLVRLAELIRGKMKGSRRAFRFGGDEMVLLFGPESLEQIKEIVEELRTEFKNTQYDFRPEKPITLSIGIAAYYKGLNEKSWFELVDSTMYKSKTHGRDSVYIA
ncbi:MAG: GGDEF domain-containing protein [Treponema sp.]|nr:GGDEF domain-containing protein [Treponema sp.]